MNKSQIIFYKKVLRSCYLFDIKIQDLKTISQKQIKEKYDNLIKSCFVNKKTLLKMNSSYILLSEFIKTRDNQTNHYWIKIVAIIIIVVLTTSRIFIDIFH